MKMLWKRTQLCLSCWTKENTESIIVAVVLAVKENKNRCTSRRFVVSRHTKIACRSLAPTRFPRRINMYSFASSQRKIPWYGPLLLLHMKLSKAIDNNWNTRNVLYHNGRPFFDWMRELDGSVQSLKLVMHTATDAATDICEKREFPCWNVHRQNCHPQP